MEQRIKFEKYVKMIENGDSRDKVSSAAQKIEDEHFKKELYAYLRLNHKVNLEVPDDGCDLSRASTVESS